jgi:hypothetical protein
MCPKTIKYFFISFRFRSTYHSQLLKKQAGQLGPQGHALLQPRTGEHFVAFFQTEVKLIFVKPFV